MRLELLMQSSLSSWAVVLLALLLVGEQTGRCVGVEDVREVTAPNSTTEKDLTSLKIRNTKLHKIASDKINDVPLTPDEDVPPKAADLASKKKVISPKELVPDNAERLANNVDTPSVNTVADGNEFSAEDSDVKILEEVVKRLADEVKNLTGEKRVDESGKSIGLVADDKLVMQIDGDVKKLEDEVKNMTGEKNNVVVDSHLSLDDKIVKTISDEVEKLEQEVKNLTTEEKLTSDDSKDKNLAQTTNKSILSGVEFEYSPKGRTLSYKDNSTGSDNSDLLKNTVPSEPKAIKLEDNVDKEGERWIKKQKGISSTAQSNPEFKTRVNKERNLSGSYLPALAVLNTVNSTSDIEVNSEKFIQKYQRRKRPWSAIINASEFSIPEETTVWSLASLKATPKDKQFGDTKPVVPWSTVVNRPTTTEGIHPKESSSTPASSYPMSGMSHSFSTGDSDWVGISKLEIADVPSTKVSSETTESPIGLMESNDSGASTSLNVLDSSSNKEVSNNTSKVTGTDDSSPLSRNTTYVIGTRKPDSSNKIKLIDTSVKISLLLSSTTAAPTTTTEVVRNLSVYPSPISNSVNELHEEEDEDIQDDRPLFPVDSSHKKPSTPQHLESLNPEVQNSTESISAVKTIPGTSFDNSDHPNATKMFMGKNSYASGFDFSSPASPTADVPNTESPSELDDKTNLTTLMPLSDEPTFNNSINSTLTPTTESAVKIVHVTSTMLPDKGKDTVEKSFTSITHSPPVTNVTESDFHLDLANMFNISKDSGSVTEISDDSINVTTIQPKELNEIPLDTVTTTEKSLRTTSTPTSPPSTSSLPELTESSDRQTPLNSTESKSNDNVNTIRPSATTDKPVVRRTNESENDPHVTSAREEIKLLDLFNSTDDFMTTVSKFPGSTYTVGKTTVSTTEQPLLDPDDVSATDGSSVTPRQDSFPTRDDEFKDKTPHFFSYPVDNSSEPDDAFTPKFYPTTDEPSKLAPILETTPNLETLDGASVHDEHDRFPSSEEDSVYDSADPVFTRLLVQANDKELCSTKEQLRDSIIRLFKTNGSEIQRKQVVINNLESKDCLARNPPSEEGLFPIQLYLTDTQGHNDITLTDNFIRLWQREGLDFTYPVKRVDKVVGRSKWVEMEDKSEGNSSLIAAILISAVAALCLLIILILLVIIRKRQKGFNYGQRCTPVSLEDYSLDNISVYNSTRRRKPATGSKRSYGNPAFDHPGAISHVVNFATLANFCNNRSMIDEEFTEIPSVTVKPDELPPGVETKNRFANVIPIPETRVVLNKGNGGDPDIDTYINANYIKGAKGEEKFYIGCQAPMAETVSDFWQMIWEQQSRLIIMLTDLQEAGVEKCADYLPPSEVLDCHRVFGDLQVTLKKREVREKYLISNLHLKNLETNLWREVVHLWLTSWPHQGVPSEPTSVIAFLIEARSYIKSKESSAPIVVHCSPGTGRTGTVIAIDICIRDFELKRTIDVPRTVANIRKDRAGAVQTKDQYAFIYQVLHTYATKLTGGGLDSI